jgi:hypothetical protein
MAQADSVRSSSRQLITGESANQSTSLPAINLPAVSVQPVDRRFFIGGSDAPRHHGHRRGSRLLALAGKTRARRPGGPVELSLLCGQHQSGAPGLEHRGSVLRGRRLFPGAVASEHPYPASVPERE